MKPKRFARLQEKYFDKKKSRYGVNKIYNPPIHTKLETEKLINLIPRNVKYVIDFGSGNGRLTIPLLEKGIKVTAVDISKPSLNQLKKITKDLKYKINTTTILKDVTKVNMVLGCDILHHVDLEKELININRKLKRGGAIAFSEPNALNPAWYVYFMAKGIFRYEKNIVNINYFGLLKMLHKCGYTNIKIVGLGFFPRAFFGKYKLCRFNDSLGNLPILKIFAYRYLIFAKKI